MKTELNIDVMDRTTDINYFKESNQGQRLMSSRHNSWQFKTLIKTEVNIDVMGRTTDINCFKENNQGRG